MELGCLHEVFEDQVDARPAGPALICGERCLSFLELDQRANRLARYLRSLGARPGVRVAIYLKRGDKPIVAILAVLKTGAAYVPIDPAYPPERIRHILDDADVGLLLTESELADQAASYSRPTCIVLDAGETQTEIRQQPAERLSRGETGTSPTDLCYIIYTSGTTGRPKGIMTEHRNVVAFTAAFKSVCRLDPSDRVYQGFSLGFDGSVEEIWMAFSNGAALVVGPPELARLGDETARFMADQGVTFFSTVPTFLNMIREDVPSLQLIVVSGEQCPPALVRRWTRPGRRMLNVYGPTETTVNTTTWDCVPEAGVKIGRALPGYETYILDEAMRPVHPGEPGELYIGGAGVARGYLNQPDLTRAHFVRNPFNGNSDSQRMYRTGDLVREDDHGELTFLGRIDGQVKVRGYRIELAEIESALRDHAEIEAAAVKVVEQGELTELAAFVVPRSGDGAALDRGVVLDMLSQRLPLYMIPGYLDPIDELPTLASGKVDRKRLPDPCTPLVPSGREYVAPRTELERKVSRVWEKLFKTAPISIKDDFFQDLRGYSLLAAQLVSHLRNEHGIEVALRDVYEHPSIAKLADHIASADKPLDEDRTARSTRTSREIFKSLPAYQRIACVVLQALSIPFLYGLMAAPVIAFGITFFAIHHGDLEYASGAAILVAVALVSYPLRLATSIGLKWLIIGRFSEEKHPVWGLYYFRLWLVDRIHNLSAIGLLSGTPVMSLYYRLMGAKVGRNTIIDTPFCTAFDLVTIGDDTCIGSETHLLGYRIEDGLLVLGSVDIGSRCFVGIHSCLGLDTCMEDDSRLGDLSLLVDGETICSGEARRGSPAETGDVPVPEPEGKEMRRRPFLFGLAHLLLVELLWLFLFVTVIPGLAIVIPAFALGGVVWGIASVFAAVPVNTVAFCLLLAALKSLILHRVEPGTYRIESWLFLRKWLIDALMGVSRAYMHAVYTTIYLPPWLRMMGARIGRLAEISTVSQVTPDLIDIAEGSFFADGSMIGGRRFFRGRVQFLRNRIGRRSFVGNNAILPVGTHLGEHCLLGVLSTPPEGRETTPDGSEWLGSPSFSLPYRQKVEGFDAKVTYAPTRPLYAQRLVIDAIRILAPGIITWLGALAFFLLLEQGWLNLHLWVVCLLAPLAASIIAVAAALCVVAVKTVVMGRFEPVIRPLWSRYVWWNEVVNGAHETVAAPALAPMLGTPFFNRYLRLMGCKIGRWAYIGTTLFSEFDLVSVGDYAALNPGVVVQNHLFEDRIMKSSYLKIGNECSVGNMSVILYDTEMKQGSNVSPLSLLMKGETIPAGSRWIGIPTHRLMER